LLDKAKASLLEALDRNRALQDEHKAETAKLTIEKDIEAAN